MNGRKRPVSILLLLLWLPAISLCHVEKVDWLPHDDCCPSSASPEAPASHPTPWASCCLLASGQYTAEAHRIPVLTEHSVSLEPRSFESLRVDWDAFFNFLNSSSIGPPESAVIWHFTQRDALAPRAPTDLA
jgi:hypothetical protein